MIHSNVTIEQITAEQHDLARFIALVGQLFESTEKPQRTVIPAKGVDTEAPERSRKRRKVATFQFGVASCNATNNFDVAVEL